MNAGVGFFAAVSMWICQWHARCQDERTEKKGPVTARPIRICIQGVSWEHGLVHFDSFNQHRPVTNYYYQNRRRTTSKIEFIYMCMLTPKREWTFRNARGWPIQTGTQTFWYLYTHTQRERQEVVDEKCVPVFFLSSFNHAHNTHTYMNWRCTRNHTRCTAVVNKSIEHTHTHIRVHIDLLIQSLVRAACLLGRCLSVSAAASPQHGTSSTELVYATKT